MKKTIILMGILCGLNATAQNWSLTGNSSTTAGTNFLGTTDNKDLVFKTNNLARLKIDNNGYIDFSGGSVPSNLFPYEAKYKFYGPTTFSLWENTHDFTIYSDPQAATLFRVDSDYMNIYMQEDFGRVIIGSKTRLNNCIACQDYKLFVQGGIKAQKVKVEIAAENGWADYVFAKDYKLMPLKEIESYINTNGHLPEVPSTDEAIKNGIELKEMNILLLKKVEELTLHLIDQNKRIEGLEANIKK